MVLLGNSIEHLRGGGTTVLHKNLSENRGMNHFPTFYENRKTLIQKSVKGIKKQQQLPGHYSSCLNYQQTEIIKILKKMNIIVTKWGLFQEFEVVLTFKF